MFSTSSLKLPISREEQQYHVKTDIHLFISTACLNAQSVSPLAAMRGETQRIHSVLTSPSVHSLNPSTSLSTTSTLGTCLTSSILRWWRVLYPVFNRSTPSLQRGVARGLKELLFLAKVVVVWFPATNLVLILVASNCTSAAGGTRFSPGTMHPTDSSTVDMLKYDY